MASPGEFNQDSEHLTRSVKQRNGFRRCVIVLIGVARVGRQWRYEWTADWRKVNLRTSDFDEPCTKVAFVGVSMNER